MALVCIAKLLSGFKLITHNNQKLLNTALLLTWTMINDIKVNLCLLVNFLISVTSCKPYQIDKISVPSKFHSPNVRKVHSYMYKNICRPQVFGISDKVRLKPVYLATEFS